MGTVPATKQKKNADVESKENGELNELALPAAVRLLPV